MNNYSVSEKETYVSIAKKADIIFIKPSPLYSYDNIVNGCSVISNVSGVSKTMYAVSNNTWRGFHRTADSAYGSKEIFTSYFIHNKDKLLTTLESVNNREELDSLEDHIYKDIKSILSGNIRADQLGSYNKIRKPVDLYIEHIVCMCSELSRNKNTLTKLLFLPLDSQIFSSPYIFSSSQLYSFGIKANASFKDVQTRKTYIALQDILYKKATDISDYIGKEFTRIYFDLLWNERYKKSGNNLFQTNI